MMSAPMRLLDTGPMSARRNIAVTAALAELHRAGQIPDTLRLCTYPRSILLGRHQRLADAVRIKACRRYRIEIARRLSGGGAAYMSPGVLAWDVVAERHCFGGRAGEVGERICSGIAAGLARFGLPARFRPLGDVEIEGRRISGPIGSIDGPTVVFQGMLLISTDRAEMATVLRPPAAFSSHWAHPNFAAHVTSLAERLCRVPPADELRGLLIAGISHCWRRALRPDALTPGELGLVDRLLDEGVGTEAFGDTLAVTAAAAEAPAGTAAAMGVRAP
jgi:lipoate-protein ligase A